VRHEAVLPPECLETLFEGPIGNFANCHPVSGDAPAQARECDQKGQEAFDHGQDITRASRGSSTRSRRRSIIAQHRVPTDPLPTFSSDRFRAARSWRLVLRSRWWLATGRLGRVRRVKLISPRQGAAYGDDPTVL
jgi:hypothetical protein